MELVLGKAYGLREPAYTGISWFRLRGPTRELSPPELPARCLRGIKRAPPTERTHSQNNSSRSNVFVSSLHRIGTLLVTPPTSDPGKGVPNPTLSLGFFMPYPSNSHSHPFPQAARTPPIFQTPPVPSPVFSPTPPAARPLPTEGARTPRRSPQSVGPPQPRPAAPRARAATAAAPSKTAPPRKPSLVDVGSRAKTDFLAVKWGFPAKPQ